jgi:4-hydroxy-tetrahydrodipicolinate synthase
MDYARDSGMDQFASDMGSVFIYYPGRPDYFTHWGGAFKYAASLLGLPIGDYPHSRPPQTELSDAGKAQIDKAYQRLGLVAH